MSTEFDAAKALSSSRMELPVLRSATCIECVHIRFDPGSLSHSELTPGYDCMFDCSKRHWSMANARDSTQSLRVKLLMAERCVDFKDFRTPA